jgi:CBS domain-containing protein
MSRKEDAMETTWVRGAIEDLLGRVESIMQPKVVVLRPDQSLREAIYELERGGVSGGPVVENGRVIGMVSLADLFRAAGVDPKLAATTGPWHRYEHVEPASRRRVAEAMNRRVVSVRKDASIAVAAQAMRENDVNRIPVMDESGGLVGIVARDDIIAAVADASRTIHQGGLHAGISWAPA